MDLRGLTNRPKIETIADKIQVSRNTVKRALQKLRTLGVLTTVKGQRQNTYQLAPDWPSLLPRQNPAGPLLRTQNPAGSLLRVQNPAGPLLRAQTEPAETVLPAQIEPARGAKLSRQDSGGPYYSSDFFFRLGVAVAAAQFFTTREMHADDQTAAAAAPLSKKKQTSELCRELLSKHPHPQQPEKAEVELQRALQSASAETIRERHAAWCDYWKANPKHFIPHLWRWFADGDWLTIPKKPANSLRAALERDRQQAKGVAAR